MTMRSFARGAVAALVLAGLAAGCVQESGSNVPTPGVDNGPASAAPSGGKRLRIAVVPKGTTHEFWQTVKAGAEAAGRWPPPPRPAPGPPWRPAPRRRSRARPPTATPA